MKNIISVLCILNFVSSASWASDFCGKLFPGCKIFIKVPDSYTVQEKYENGSVKTYECRSSEKEKFLNVTFEPEKKIQNDSAAIKTEALIHVKEDLAVSANKKIDAVEIRDGSSIIGYYYIVRMNSEYPDNMRYMFNGNILKKDMWIGFRSFNSSGFKSVDEFLSILKNISYKSYKQIKYRITDITPVKSDFKYPVSSGDSAICSNGALLDYFNYSKGQGPGGLDPVSTRVQSFEAEGERGSVFYFQYPSFAEHNLGYFKIRFNRADHPNESFPEDIIIDENMMVVFSFGLKSKLKDDVEKIIIDKMKSVGE